MRCVAIGTLLAAGLALSGAHAADDFADELTAAARPAAPAPAADADIAAELTASRNPAARALFFSGAEMMRSGYFAHGGFLWAPNGLDQDGPVFKLLLYGGRYRYHSGTTQITGRQFAGSALPGWRFRRDGLEVTVFAGPDVQEHRYTPADPANRLGGTHYGVRGGGDVWYEPFRDAMLTGSVSLSTIGKTYWTRAATGWRLFDAVWIGPEVHAVGDDTFGELRFGVHVSSLRLWNYEWSAGAGWTTNTDKRNGPYGRIGVVVRK